MSQRLTRKGFITSLTDDPSMRGLNAYLAGRRQFRDAGGHGTGGAGDAGGDDTPPDDGGSDAEESDDEDDDSEDDDTKDTKAKKGKDAEEEDEESVPKWKYDKLHKRMTAADQNASALRKQLDDLKANADVPAEVKRELEQVKSRVSEVEAERDKHAATNRTLSIKLASLTMKGVPQWANAETALKLADLSDVDIDEDTGKVDTKALKAALNALAKEHPYLVAKETKGDTGNESGTGSATKMNGNRKGERGAPDKTTLAKRFPALSRTTAS